MTSPEATTPGRGTNTPGPTADRGELLELAVALARRAGSVIVEMRPDAVGTATTKSSPTDPVTEADAAAEEIIVGGLGDARPHDTIVGEEGTDRTGTSGISWYVDPIDGTVNYLYGLPLYSVSIAAAVGAETVIGVVYNPISDELFTATAGGGAYRNGAEISVTDRPDLTTSVISTGFSYRSDRRKVQADILSSLLPRIGDIRRLGSAALDLCMVAAGRVDGFYEESLNIWDYAAGKLVVEEAGGRCDLLTDTVSGAEVLVAGSPLVADGLIRLLAETQD
jgi:myo-inositol-1(or 4)-monophosphatase